MDSVLTLLQELAFHAQKVRMKKTDNANCVNIVPIQVLLVVRNAIHAQDPKLLSALEQRM